MLKLNLTNSPETIALPYGAFLTCAPNDVLTAQQVMADLAGEDDSFDIMAFHMALAQRQVTGWGGIHGQDGVEVPFAEDLVPAVLRDPVVMRRFREQYGNRALGLVAEGNGSSSSPDGISGADEDTAQPAPSAAPSVPTTSIAPAAPADKASGASS